MMSEGVSRRAYAKTRGISEAAVRAHIERGLLAPAVMDNGLIDAAKADEILADVPSSPPRRVDSPSVKKAKLRRLRAQVALLNDEVTQLADDYVPSDSVETAWVPEVTAVATACRELPALIGPTAGQQPREAAETIRTLVNAALNKAADAVDALPYPFPRAKTIAPDIDSMNMAGLIALKNNLDAERFELERAIAHGLLRRHIDVVDEQDVRIAVFKSILNTAPDRLAILAADSSPAELIALMADEVERSLANLSPHAN